MVLRHYHSYVEALRAAHLDAAGLDVQRCRGILARAIEVACTEDPELLPDFKRAFAARPQA
jgi:hypothetical protein